MNVVPMPCQMVWTIMSTLWAVIFGVMEHDSPSVLGNLTYEVAHISLCGLAVESRSSKRHT